MEPHIENTAMMQVSRYHKDKGDAVELYNHLFHSSYDKVYAFSVFSFSDKSYVRSDMICGGTGFDIKTKLPSEIEKCELDYGIFQKCRTSYIWFSRGCPNRCPFCVVWKKEGNIIPVKPKNLNPKGKYITVQDNNFFANPNWKDAIKQLKEWDQPVDFQGVDARRLTDEMCHSLMELRHHKQIKIAWDNPKDRLLPNLERISRIIKPWRIMCYVLIGYWSTMEEDLFRVETLRNLGIDPFVMPFNKKDPYQRHFARWVNHKAIFGSCTWKEYQKRKKINF